MMQEHDSISRGKRTDLRRKKFLMEAPDWSPGVEAPLTREPGQEFSKKQKDRHDKGFPKSQIRDKYSQEFLQKIIAENRRLKSAASVVSLVSNQKTPQDFSSSAPQKNQYFLEQQKFQQEARAEEELRKVKAERELSRVLLLQQQQQQLYQLEQQRRTVKELSESQTRQHQSDLNRLRDRYNSIAEGNRLSQICQLRQEQEEKMKKLEKGIAQTIHPVTTHPKIDNIQSVRAIAKQDTALAHRQVKEMGEEQIYPDYSVVTRTSQPRSSRNATQDNNNEGPPEDGNGVPSARDSRSGQDNYHINRTNENSDQASTSGQSHRPYGDSTEQEMRVDNEAVAEALAEASNDPDFNRKLTGLIATVASFIKQNWVDDEGVCYWKESLDRLHNFNNLVLVKCWEQDQGIRRAFQQLSSEDQKKEIQDYVDMQKSHKYRLLIGKQLEMMNVPLPAIGYYVYNYNEPQEVREQNQTCTTTLIQPPSTESSITVPCRDPSTSIAPVQIEGRPVPMEVDQCDTDTSNVQEIEKEIEKARERIQALQIQKEALLLHTKSNEKQFEEYAEVASPVCQPSTSRALSCQKKKSLLSKRTLYNILTNDNYTTDDVKLEKCYLHCLQKLNFKLNPEECRHLKKLLQTFLAKFRERWTVSHRTKSKFENSYNSWLDTDFMVPAEWMDIRRYVSPTSPESQSLPKDYEKKSVSGKRKDEEALSLYFANIPEDLLFNSLKIFLRKQDNKGLASVIDMFQKGSDPKELLRKLKHVEREIVPYSPQEALSLLLDVGMSKAAYSTIAHGARAHGMNLFPAYGDLGAEKSCCRPHNINVEELRASVSLQDLLNTTTYRLVQLNESSILRAMKEKNIQHEFTTLICSWGFDGSTGQSTYKRKYTSSAALQPDSALFATTLIPLKLIDSAGQTLWQNPSPSSVRFCRPLKLEYIKETRDHILREKKDVDDQIAALQDVGIILGDELVVTVNFDLHMTLIDGKVLSHITGTSSFQNCPLCGASPLMFNNVDNIESPLFQPREGHLEFGLSPLHCWIRCMEWLLHVAYRLDFKEWRTTAATKPQLQARKLEIQQKLKSEMGLLVDIPKDGGNGTTNDGNTARRAFQDFRTFARVLGLDEDVVKDLRTLLIAISCQEPLNASAFEAFCKNFINKYNSRYWWYPMPETAHKLLIHGAEIIRKSVLPIGFFSEEAAESRHKFYRYDRIFHARKDSPMHNMFDVFTRAMDSSDPIMASFRQDERSRLRHRAVLPDEVRQLLAVNSHEIHHEEDEDGVDEVNVVDVIDHLLDTFQLSEDEH